MSHAYAYVLDDDAAKASRVIKSLPSHIIGIRKESIWECHESIMFPLVAVFIDMSALDCGAPPDIEQAFHQIRALAKDRHWLKVFITSEMPSSGIRWIECEVGLPNVRAINVESALTVLAEVHA